MNRGRLRYQPEQQALLGDPEEHTDFNHGFQLRNRGQSQEPAVGYVQHQNNNNNNPFASALARFDFVNHEVQPGDTLAGIALRYNCKLSLLKQANNLASEAHLAALPLVRVPVPRNGVLTGQLVDISAKVEIQREGPAREELCPQKFMEDLDEKLKVFQQQAPPPGTPPPLRSKHQKPSTLLNSTCLMFICLVGVCVGLPILYTVYILTYPYHGDVFKLIPS